MTNSRSPHHSELTIVEYATGDTLHGQQRTDALRIFRNREALPGDLVFSMPDGTWSSYAGFVDWTGFEDEPVPAPLKDVPFTREEQRTYDALEAEYTDLCAVPSAHEVYKGGIAQHLMAVSMHEPEKYAIRCADSVLDLYQAFDRRLHERKVALKEGLAETIKGRSRYVEGT